MSHTRYIAQRLRAADHAELRVTRSPENFMALAIDAWIADAAFVAYTKDNEPAFVYGFHIQDRSARIWGFGTDRASEVARSVTKHCLVYMMPLLLSHDIDRAYCLVQPSNDLSKRWLEFLGFAPEATVSEIGPEREDLILYSRGRDARPDTAQGSDRDTVGCGDRACVDA